MHVEYPRDLFIPLKSIKSSFGEIYFILPYLMLPKFGKFRYGSRVLCLRYHNGKWDNPLITNPDFGLDLTWDTDEWEITEDVPDKEELVIVLFRDCQEIIKGTK